MTNEILEYLNNAMSDKQRADFEKRLANDQELRRKVKLHREVDIYLEKDAQIDDLKNRVKGIHMDLKARKARQKKRNLTYVMAAAASVMIIVGSMFAYRYISYSPAYIYTQNYEAWDPGAITRGEDTDKNLRTLVGYYHKAQYQKVIDDFDLLTGNVDFDASIGLLKACSHMEIEEYQKALNVLDSIDASNSTMLGANVSWYSGLCYLRLKEFERAKSSFETLPAISKKYGPKAQKILKKIGNK